MREGWDLKTLADLFDIGSSKRVYESQWRNAGVPFYRAREIVKLSRDGYVDNELFIDEELYEEYANKYGIPKCGDLMVTGVGTLGVCYIVRENDKFYFKDGNILWFKSKKGTNPFYVRYAFKSNYLRQQIENCNGATVGTFTIVRAKKTTIPVPPLAEQERIVDELDLLQDIIEKKKEQLKAYDQLAQSIFYTMFGDPITNEKGWQVKKLGEICENCDSMRKPITAKDREQGEIPYYGASGIVDYVKDYIFDGDYLLISEDGANLIARSTPIAFSIKGKTWVNNHAHVLKFTNQITQQYVEFSINLRDVSAIVTGCAQPKLTQANLNRILISFPPLSLQQEFAEKVEAIERQKALVQQSIEETQTMFDYTMDKYFG